MLPSALLMLAAGWFAACSGDEQAVTLSQTSARPLEAISFGGEIGSQEDQVAGTRGALEDTHSTFQLYGYKNTTYDATAESYGGLQTVFPGYILTHAAGTAGTATDNTDDWSYVSGSQTIKYWDYSATAYRFVAYAPATAAVSHAKTDNTATLTFTADVANPDAVPYISTMWFSNNAPEMPAYGRPVQMTFQRPYAQVRFMFIGEDSQPLVPGSVVANAIVASSIEFKPTDGSAIATAGTLQVTYPLTGTGTKEQYALQSITDGFTAFTVPYEAAAPFAVATEAEKWYTVLPNSGQGSYTITLDYLINTGVRTAVVPASYLNWQPGYRYTYVFKITEKALTFQPQLYVYTKWQTGYSGTADW